MNRRSFLTALGAAVTQGKLIRLRDDYGEFALEDPGIGLATPAITTTRYPYVQNLRSDRISVLWAALESGAGIVEYSSDGINFNRASARSRVFTAAESGTAQDFVQYQANITGLQPSTDYVYRVSIDGLEVTPGGDTRFRTAGPGPFNFVVLGDSGYGSAEQYAIAQKILAEKPALVIHTGDLVYNPGGAPGSPVDLYQRNYFNYYYQTMSSVPFFPALGNHDYGPTPAAYLAVHALPTENVHLADRHKYYSFDWGNVHFISLDGHESLESAVTSGGPMLQWLENDLRSTRQFWRIVYFHYPPFAAGPNMNDFHSGYVRDKVVPILENYGVQVVLTGHEHSYQRSRPTRKSAFVPAEIGTNYISSGGGGAFLYPVFDYPVVAFGKSDYHYLRAEVRGTQITFHAIRHDGVEIDTYSVAPRPMFSDDPTNQPVVMTPGPTAGATVRILGRALAAEETFACTPVPPTDMAGTTVTVNGNPIQLLYVSDSQIYGQLPFSVDGNVTIRVTTANGSSEMSL